MAERQGFEPWIRFWRILTFQASAFDHSATAPHEPDARNCKLRESGSYSIALEGGSLSRGSAGGKGMLYFPARPLSDRFMTSRLAAALLAPFVATAAMAADPPVTPSAVVAQAPATAWRAIPAEDLLILTIEGGKRVVIQLAPRLAPAYVANIRTLAKAGWWDGTSINRVQDNYVVQWGDATEKKALPQGMPTAIGEHYTVPLAGLGSG